MLIASLFAIPALAAGSHAGAHRAHHPVHRLAALRHGPANHVAHSRSLLSVPYLHHGRSDQLTPEAGAFRRHPRPRARLRHASRVHARAGHRRHRRVTVHRIRVLHSHTATSSCAPATPTGVSATSSSANQATISWAASTDTTITGYVVTAYAGTAPENAIGEPASATSATLTGLAGGNYTFQVVAQNSCGNSAAGVSSPATTVGGSSTYASSVIALHPSTYFRFSEPDSTAILADSSGHGLVAPYSGWPYQLGNAGAIPGDPDGSANNVGNYWWSPLSTVTSPTLPVGNEARTIQTWVKPSDGSCHWVLSFGGTGTANGFGLGECANAVMISGYNDDLSFATPAPITDGAWHLITVTYNGTQATAYLDGRAIGAKSFPTPLSTSTGDLVLGGSIGNCCYYSATGELDDAAVYPTALTAAQVASLFTASGYGVPSVPAGPSATSPSANSAMVTWTASTAPNASVTSYMVTAKLGSVVEQTMDVPGTATAATFTGLPAGTTGTNSFTFTVTAIDPYGSSAAAATTATSVTGTATTYASTVLADKPSVFYRLDEPAGAPLAADSAGHGITAAYSSAYCLGQAITGPLASDAATGASTNGCDNVAAVNYRSGLPSGSSSRTMQAWVKPGTSSCQWFLGYGGSYTDGAFSIGECGNAVLASLYSDDHSFYSPRNIADGNWHLVTVTDTYSAASGNSITAYVDGQKLGTVTTAAPNTQAGTGLQIGGAPYGSYDGAIGDAAVYPAALSAGQVTALMVASGYSVPTAVGAPTGSSPGANQATISWAPSTAQGTSVSYYIASALLAGKVQQALAVPGTSHTAAFDGLAPGTYSFKVIAYDAYGASGPVTSTPGNNVVVTAPAGAPATYPATVMASKPVMYYRLGENGTSVAADSSGGNNIGYYNAGNVTQGVPGAVADGHDQAVSTNWWTWAMEAPAATTIPAGDSDRTVEAWVKSANGCNNDIVSFGNYYATDQSFTLGECGNQVFVDAWGDTRWYYTPQTVDDGAWHFLAATYSDLNGVDQVTAYLDGQSLGTQQFTGTLATPAGSTLWVGAGPNGCCSSMYGSVDEVAVFASALAPTAIAAQFAAAQHPVPKAPTALTATAGTNQVSVSWTAPTPSDPLTGYLVSAYSGTKLLESQSAGASALSATLTGLPKVATTVKVTPYNSYGAGATATSSAVTPTGSTTTYSSLLQADGPVAYYRLDDQSGAPFAADSSGQGDQALYNQSVTTFGYTPALATDPAPSVSDNGGDAAGRGAPVLGNGLPVANHARTMMAWVNPSDGNCRYVMGYGAEQSAQGFALQVCANSVGVIGWGDDLWFNSVNTLDDGNWHQVAVTSDGTSATVYVDGQSIGTQPFATTLNTSTGTGLFIGAGTQDTGWQFYGGLAQAAVLPSALSAAQIGALFTASGYSPPSAPGTVAATAGANQATVTWGAATSAAGVPVSGYVVTALQEGTTAVNAVATAGTDSSVTISGLPSGHPYTFRVVAYNGYGAGPAATSATGVTPTGATTTYASAVLALNPSAYLRLGEADGRMLADSSGNGAIGIYDTNNTTLGQAGALADDPTTSISNPNAWGWNAQTLSNVSLPSGNAARSMAIWVKPFDGYCRPAMGYGNGGWTQSFDVEPCGSSINVQDSAYDLSFSTGSANVADGNWHQIVVSYDGAGNVTAYLDGVNLGTQAFYSPPSTPSGAALVVGADPWYGSFYGQLQDAAVFPTALTGSQVAALYAAR